MRERTKRETRDDAIAREKQRGPEREAPLCSGLMRKSLVFFFLAPRRTYREIYCIHNSFSNLLLKV